MIKLIELAKKEILIASPWIWESKEVLDAMKIAVDEKHIRVRIVTRTADYEKDQKHKATVLTLHKLGFQIEHDEKVHAKLLLIDDTELLIGSANLVDTSLNRNHEVALCTNHPKTVRDAKIYFTDLMADIFIKKIDKVVTE